VAIVQEETASATWRHVPSQSNPADLISKGIEPATLSTSTLWWKGPQCLTQEPSSWPATEVNTPTENLEISNVHVALQQPPEDITQRFSKLNKLIRVIAYCRRVINNCRHPKSNRQPTTLSTQDLDRALTCWVKMVQQISYAQEMQELTEEQGVSATSSQNIASKQLHEGYDMLKSSSLMARVQDFLAIEGRDWRFIPLRGSRFGGLGSSSNIHDVPPENTGFSHCYLTKKFPHYLLRYRPV